MKKKKRLRIYLLGWDFAMIYAMEREFFPRYKLKWTTHKRVQFCLDGEHPLGASQHQKIVVIDDAVAFSGGFDLSKWRWDTSEHRPDNILRTGPDGEHYNPFHDVQMVVDGQAAKALGELANERWERACGEKPIIDDQAEIVDPWPMSVQPDFEEVRIAISRTFPAYKNYREVREVEQLYLDSIAAAENYIYIENQYLSSYRLGNALTSRLQQTEGPEVAIVQPKKTGGWLEQHTMDVLRGRIMHSLKEADLHSRLRIYYPRLSINPEINLMVHAKIMIIDDCFVRIGSSNLSNRSLGLDSECDMAISTKQGSKEAAAISAFRNRLIAEHLGVRSDDVAQTFIQRGSLIEAIESLRKGERTLVPLDGDIPKEIDIWVPESELLDPEKPIEPEELFDYFIDPEQQLSFSRRLLNITLMITGLLSFMALLRWTSVGSEIDIDTVLGVITWIRQQPYSPLAIPLVYVLGGLVSFPVTLLIIATVMIFGPWQGLFYTLIGTELSALVTFLVGRWLGHNVVKRFAGTIFNRLNLKLSDTGLKAVILFRLFPIAPFSVLNMVAGVTKIHLRDFAVGNFIGLLPSVIVLVVVANWFSDSLILSDWDKVTVLLSAIMMTGTASFILFVWLRRGKQVRKKIYRE
ncbi:MAG: VTT domain-containing protein [Gammaproteobacteria bacterium]